MPYVDEVRAYHNVALDSLGRASIEDRTETRGVPVKIDDVKDYTGPINRRYSPAGLTGAVTTDSVSDSVIFAARARLIKRSASVVLDGMLNCEVAEAAYAIPNEMQRVPEAS